MTVERPASGQASLPPSHVATGAGAPIEFRSVYDTLYRPVANYLWRRTGDSHATEDLLADVFLAVFTALPRYRDRGLPIRHWVFRIANRAATRWLHRRARELQVMADHADVAGLIARPADATHDARQAAPSEDSPPGSRTASCARAWSFPGRPRRCCRWCSGRRGW